MLRRIYTHGFLCFLIVGLISLAVGCFNAPPPSPPVNNDQNLCKEKVISVEVGSPGVINVLTDKSVNIAVDNSYVTASLSGKTINVTGVSLGISKITVSTSDKSEEVTVRVDDPKALQYKDLLITWTDQFNWVYQDEGTGADEYLSCWKPICPPGYYPLGTYAKGEGNWDSPTNNRAVIIVKAINDSTALAAPVDYVEVWNDHGSGGDYDVSIWKPVPPAGYVALGLVVVGNYSKPSLDEIRCVRSDLVANGIFGAHIYNDGGSGADLDLDACEVECPSAPNIDGMAYLKPGTFTGNGIADCLYVLNVKLPVITDMNDSTYVPRLDSYNEPDEETPAYLAKEVATPFTLIIDAAHDLHWKVTNSPIYHLRRDEFYRNQYFYNNQDGSEPVTHTITNTTGVTSTTSTTYSATVGLSISAEAGCDLIGGSVTVELSAEFGYETSSSLEVFAEHTVEQGLTIPAGKSGCLWQKATQFSLFRRNVGWELVGGELPNITVESFVIGQYPHN